MQIVLIDPLLDYRAHCVSETLGLMYIAAVLREAVTVCASWRPD